MKKTATILMIIAMASPVWASFILEYDIAGADGEKAQIATTAANVSATTLTAIGVRTRNPNQGYTGMVAASNWPTGSSPASGKYFEFSLTIGFISRHAGHTPSHSQVYETVRCGREQKSLSKARCLAVIRPTDELADYRDMAHLSRTSFLGSGYNVSAFETKSYLQRADF